MVPALAMAVALFVQAPVPARSAARVAAPDPVQVWRTDSTAYVQLSQPGHLVVLHVDAIGRIAVLFPSAPWDSTAVSADVPVTIAWGTKDRLLVRRQGVRALREIPGARLVRLPGCGHVPMSDDPALVGRVILDACAAAA